MSIPESLLRTAICYSLVSPAGTPTASTIATFKIPESKQKATMYEYADKIIKQIKLQESPNADLTLPKIDQALEEHKSELIERCVNALMVSGQSKAKGVLTTEISQLLSSVHVNMQILQTQMTSKEIEEVIILSLADCLKKEIFKNVTDFELSLTLKLENKLSKNETSFLDFHGIINTLLAKSISVTIKIGKNPRIDNCIISFIKRNGQITLDVGMDLFREIYPLIKVDLKSNLEQCFFDLTECADMFLNSPTIVKEKPSSRYKSYIKEYASWALTIIKHKILTDDSEELLIPLPHLIIQNRRFLFNQTFMEDKRLFFLFMDFHKEIKEFIQKDKAILELFKKHFKTPPIFNKEDVLAAVLTCICIYNSIYNNTIESQLFYKMDRNEIFQLLSRNIEQLTENKWLQNEHSDVFGFMSVDVMLYIKHPWNDDIEDDEFYSAAEVKYIACDLFKDKQMLKASMNLLQELHNSCQAKSLNISAVGTTLPEDRELKMMLMIAVGERAEQFIKSHYTILENSILESRNSTSILKEHNLLKTLMTSLFLSQLAKGLEKIRHNTKTDKPQLELKIALIEVFQGNNCEIFNKDNILQQLESKLFNSMLCLEVLSLSNVDVNSCIQNLKDRLQTLLRNTELDSVSKSLYENQLLICSSTRDIITLTLLFFYDIFKGVIQKQPLPTRLVQNSDVMLFKSMGGCFIQPALDDLITSEFVELFTVIAGEYLNSNPLELSRLERLINKKGSNVTTVRNEFITEKEITHQFKKDFSNCAPYVIAAFVIVFWGKTNGLKKLNELKGAKPSDLILEIFKYEVDINEVVIECKNMKYSSANRCLFYIGGKLMKNSTDEAFSRFESAAKSVSYSLYLNNYVDKYFKDILKGLRKYINLHCLKKQLNELSEQSASSRITDQKQQHTLDPVQEFLPDSASSTSSQSVDSKIETPQSEQGQQKLESSKERKQRLYMEERRRRRELQKELALLEASSSDCDSSDDKSKEDKVIGCDAEKNTAFSDERLEASGATATKDSSLSEEDPEIDLTTATVDEILYTGQNESLEELDLEEEGLTQEQRDLLLKFAYKMKVKVFDNIYKKGFLDGSTKKSNKATNNWDYKYECASEEDGVEAPTYQNSIIINKSFSKWLEKQNPRIKEEIERRFNQIIKTSSFGNRKALHSKLQGAFELKFRDAVGTRIYYLPKGNNVYILCGGDKSDQEQCIADKLPILVSELKESENFV